MSGFLHIFQICLMLNSYVFILFLWPLTSTISYNIARSRVKRQFYETIILKLHRGPVRLIFKGTWGLCLSVSDLAVTARYEKIVGSAGLSMLGPLHRRVLGARLQVCLVGEREGASLELLVELRPTEAVLLLDTSGVVQVVELPGVAWGN